MKLMEIFDVPAQETSIPVPYVIAEAGVNHEGSMDIARRLVDEAAEGGAVVQLLADKNAASDGLQDYLQQWHEALSARGLAWLDPPRISQQMR